MDISLPPPHKPLLPLSDPPPEEHFQLVFPTLCFNVDRELLLMSDALRPFVELADLEYQENLLDYEKRLIKAGDKANQEPPPEKHSAITLDLPAELAERLRNLLLLLDRLMDEPEMPFEANQTQLQLSQTLRLSEHFKFTELSRRIRLILAQQLADAEVGAPLCKILGVECDFTEDQQSEAERHCNIFK